MGFTTLRSAITSKLEGVTELADVKDAHTDVFDGYPAATFEPSRNDNDFLTTVDNLRGYAFDIIVYAEISEGGRSNAITVLSAAVDAIITAFDEDIGLGGACDWTLALPSSWGEYTAPGGPLKYAMLTLVCNDSERVVT